MKKIILSAAIFAIAGYASVFSNNPSDVEKQLRSQIMRGISYPSSALENNIKGLVKITFTVDEAGLIKLVRVKGEEKTLCAYVQSQVDGQKVEIAPENKGKIYSINIAFQLN